MSTTSPTTPQPTPPTPPEAWEPLFRFARLARRPLERFLRIEAASGILLVVAAAVALVVRVGVAQRPRGLSNRHLVVVGALLLAPVAPEVTQNVDEAEPSTEN